MALWDRLRQELDRAGRTAAEAVDEGRLRLDLYRARQSADRCAQKLGYAVFRARSLGGELSADEYSALSNDLRNAEAEVTRYNTLISEASMRRKANAPGGAESAAPASDSSTASPPPPPPSSSPPPDQAQPV
jgi:hypothetical protein